MYKSFSEIDPNEIVTKSYLKTYLNQAFVDFENRFEKKMAVMIDQKLDEKLDKKLKEQSKEYQRYIGALSEEFQSRLSAVAEMVIEDRGDILRHDEAIKRLLLKLS